MLAHVLGGVVRRKRFVKRARAELRELRGLFDSLRQGIDMPAYLSMHLALQRILRGGGQGLAEGAIVLNRVAASGACMNGSTSLHLTMFGLSPVIRFGSERLKAALAWFGAQSANQA